MGDSATFQIDVGVGGADSLDAAARSVGVLADRLTKAGAASVAASDAVKAGEASYRQAEATADRAAKALEKISVAADAQQGKLKAALDAGDASGAERAAAKLQNLIDRQGEAASKATAATAALGAEASALDALKAAASTAADEEKVLTDKLEKAEEAADKLAKAQGSGKANEAAEALGKLGGPLGRLGQQAFGAKAGMDKLFSSLGGAAGPAIAAVGFVALAAAVVAVGIALGVAAVSAVKLAVGLADANRTQALLAQGIAGTVDGGDRLNAQIRYLTTQVPQTKEELLAMAQQLAATGLKGDDLATALEDTATKAAKLKYGPDFEKQTRSLSSLAIRLQDNIAHMFGGLKIDALLSGFARLVGLFDDTQITGKAIKVVFESIFQPLIDGIVDVIPKIESGFIQFEIMAVRGLTAIKPYTAVFKAWAPYLAPVWTGIKAIAVVVGVLVALAIASAVAFVAPFVAMGAAGVYALGKIAEFASAAWDYLSGLADKIVAFASSLFSPITDAVSAVLDFLQAFSLSEVGSNLIAGLAAGITGGAQAVIGAVTGAVGGAIDSAKSLLGIASPSKVFASIGQNTAAGMAVGVDQGASDVQSSLESLVAPPATKSPLEGLSAPATKPGGAASTDAKSSSSSSGVSLSGVTFNLYGVEGADDAVSRFKELMTFVLQGDVSQFGAAT